LAREGGGAEKILSFGRLVGELAALSKSFGKGGTWINGRGSAKNKPRKEVALSRGGERGGEKNTLQEMLPRAEQNINKHRKEGCHGEKGN